jgi:putative acetyltransferase
MEIRVERSEDVSQVRQVHEAAFGRSAEADLVDRLRGVESTLSFVAVEADRVIGHILFSPVTIDNTEGWFLGLAPVAVMPEYQRQGVGSALIRAGLVECEQLGVQAIVVLGSPAYYGRFGFIPARERNLRCVYDAPEEAFMVLELVQGALQNAAGVVQYRPEFSAFE